ncbi:hypothetical protein [Streptomyces viridosporus]|uniref:hypothetical protein n=1 Tax=Streptomyces viridosporus TaxID=67581 RepID=UPI0036F774C2
MRTSKPLLGSGPVAAAAVLALALTGPAAANTGISVSTTGSTVSVTTRACTQANGSWGSASLLTSSQTSFSQGRQVALSGTASGQSAAWGDVAPGTYTVIVMCSNGNPAGTQSVIVSPAPDPPAATPAASPSLGVLGGIGGGSKDYGTVALVTGGTLVGTGLLATAWYVRRRSRPRHP